MSNIKTILKWGKRVVTTLVITLLITLNVLTLTWDVASATAQSALSAIGVTSVLAAGAVTAAASLAAAKKANTIQSRKHKAEKLKIKNTVRKTLAPVRGRIVTRAVVGVSSTVAEVLPFVGAAAAIGALSYELYSSCQDAQTIVTLEALLGMEDIKPIPSHCKAILDLNNNP